jgi:cytochrome c551/c552
VTPETPERDPILSRSMSGPLLVSALLMLASLGWALYDEFVGLRPWKGYQRRFASVYSEYLEKAIPVQAKKEQAVRQSPELQKIEQALAAEEKRVGSEVDALDKRVGELDRRIAALTDSFATARVMVSALTYKLETTESESGKASLQKKIDEAKKGPFKATLPVPDGTVEKVSYDYDELIGAYNGLKDEKGDLIGKRVALLREATRIRAERDAYLKEHLDGLTEQQLRSLEQKARTASVEIRQINVPDTQLVDRCESCHLAVREPVVLTAADMGGEKAFTSHPTPELLAIHDPETFGCSPCHGGNGRAVSSVEKAHGRYHHWLWPQYARENVEAGCQQCHARDMVLRHAEVLNEGKHLYRDRGCIGCHRFVGFDDEAERLLSTRQEIAQLHQEKDKNELEVVRLIAAGDRAASNEDAQKSYRQAEELRLRASDIDASVEQLEDLSKSLQREVKKVGPNLKEIRVKLRPEWVPVWITDPHAFRPTTKMPKFRLEPDEVHAIAAFLWQSGLDATIERQPQGDPVAGKELFETRGCMGCHSVGEGSARVGGDFAANLTRLGEKANYDYIVRWVHNPRERTRPYCPLEKRDLGPEDYAKRGVPFLFDLDHSTCPNDGAQLVVQQMTVMPSLRLTWEEARDIASWLLTLRKADARYEAAPYLTDAKLKAKGQDLVRHYGCAGCHEIAGMEDEGRIGTELTTEGSKPIERLDFAHLTETAKREEWYDAKGFFERKLAKPEVFDEGRVHTDRLEKLRMPKPNLDEQGIRALTTLLVGSVDPPFPAKYLYTPAGAARDVQAGWWLVTKYNCTGCHVIRPGQKSSLMSVPRYQDPDWKDQLPPSLLGEGARANPEWLARFLENPALSETDTNRNGVRTYLKARMPTFFFSPDEIRILVRFFAALSDQAQPYLPAELPPLSPQERQMARELFTSPGAPCLKCHATGDKTHDERATAPNFLLASDRLKPAWTKRWLLDPARIAPGTAMPSGLFRKDGDRWVFSGPVPHSFAGYPGDHADLLVRYIFELTAEEQRSLQGRTRVAAAAPAGGRPLLESRASMTTRDNAPRPSRDTRGTKKGNTKP